VEAEVIDRYPEWASQRGFVLDRAVAQAVVDALEVSALEQAALPGQPLAATATAPA
jgi:hypothetical protein